ncbi:Uncharacterised protein [Bordetella pertussis]|nr:Uncharacterised protein [Bordetella pertussis]CPL39075.1 Uncharacterised protein [Bordetella pertussis]
MKHSTFAMPSNSIGSLRAFAKAPSANCSISSSMPRHCTSVSGGVSGDSGPWISSV